MKATRGAGGGTKDGWGRKQWTPVPEVTCQTPPVSDCTSGAEFVSYDQIQQLREWGMQLRLAPNGVHL